MAGGMRSIGIGTLVVGIVALVAGVGLWFYQTCRTGTGLFGGTYTFCQVPYQSEGFALLIGGFIIAVVGVILTAIAAGRPSLGGAPAQCPRCGAEIRPTDRFCRQCGFQGRT